MLFGAWMRFVSEAGRGTHCSNGCFYKCRRGVLFVDVLSVLIIRATLFGTYIHIRRPDSWKLPMEAAVADTNKAVADTTTNRNNLDKAALKVVADLLARQSCGCWIQYRPRGLGWACRALSWLG